ncbi:MAG: hypothetical protein QOJ65_1920 [Fimbriimonadaceae bacterium]|jgi:hypothetical protein|nr:hypothetical protein [Fimbriimonadaceae bacterium]
MLCLSAILLLSTAVPAPRQSATSARITYTTVAVPLGTALDKISTQAGAKLYASDELHAEPVILRVKDASLQDLMKHLAIALDAEWRRPKGGGYELYRSPELVAKISKRTIEERAKQIQSSIEKKLKEVEALGNFTPEAAERLASAFAEVATPQQPTQEQDERRSVLSNQMPDQRAIWRMIVQVDPKELAAIPSGERVVFSNRPTPTQRALPEAVLDSAERWHTEHDLFAQKLDRALAGAEVNGATHSEGEPKTWMEAKPERVVLGVSRAFPNEMQIDLIGYDAHNKPLAAVSGYLRFEDQGRLHAAAEGMDVLVKENPPGTTPIELSSATQDLIKLAKQRPGPTGASLVTGELRKQLLNPETCDPLSTVVSDALMALATQEDKNLVAVPKDDLLWLCRDAAVQGQLQPRWLRRIISVYAALTDVKLTDEGGWLDVGSEDPLEAQTERVDRAALGTFFRAVDENGYMSIEDCGKLALSINGHRPPSLVNRLTALLRPDVQAYQEGTLDLIRFYANLSPEQRESLLAGRSVRVADLNREQMTALEDLAYQNRGYAEAKTSPMSGNHGTLYFMAAQEPTELFPRGIPADAFVTATASQEDLYFAASDFEGYVFIERLNFSSLVARILRAERPDLFPGRLVTVKTIATGLKRTLNLRLTAGDITRSNSFDETIKTGNQSGLDALPPELKARLDRELAKMREAIQNGALPQPTSKPPR